MFSPDIKERVFAAATAAPQASAVVLGAFAVYGMFGAPALVNCVSVAYPIVESHRLLAVHAHGSRSAVQTLATQWLTYWVLFGFFAVVETFPAALLWVIPSYYAWKLGFVFFLVSPYSGMGAARLFEAVIGPLLDAAEEALTLGSAAKDGGDGDGDSSAGGGVSINLALVGALCALGVLSVPRRVSFWLLLLSLFGLVAALVVALFWLAAAPDGAIVVNATVALHEDGAPAAADAAAARGMRLKFALERAPYAAQADEAKGAATKGESLGRLRVTVRLQAGATIADVARLRGQLKSAVRLLVAPLFASRFADPTSGDALVVLHDVVVETREGGEALEIAIVLRACPAWWVFSSTAISYLDFSARLFAGAPPPIVSDVSFVCKSSFFCLLIYSFVYSTHLRPLRPLGAPRRIELRAPLRRTGGGGRCAAHGGIRARRDGLGCALPRVATRRDAPCRRRGGAAQRAPRRAGAASLVPPSLRSLVHAPPVLTTRSRVPVLFRALHRRGDGLAPRCVCCPRRLGVARGLRSPPSSLPFVHSPFLPSFLPSFLSFFLSFFLLPSLHPFSPPPQTSARASRGATFGARQREFYSTWPSSRWKHSPQLLRGASPRAT